ncbi:hypothetical protein IEQ34_007137 [Dendrobium chrysotoxum]|uniref:Disease resistance R13L4/SHOC-2-like LRR domain-containing protein n=1 Tax=Dendrobium chrysotoxum TaxID=161865 RepID=A0AAV7H616_DENCH|nr:hypothetical protein IEQ34_007137 [Dendrobium chrysotoxum]
MNVGLRVLQCKKLVLERIVILTAIDELERKLDGAVTDMKLTEGWLGFGMSTVEERLSRCRWVQFVKKLFCAALGGRQPTVGNVPWSGVGLQQSRGGDSGIQQVAVATNRAVVAAEGRLWGGDGGHRRTMVAGSEQQVAADTVAVMGVEKKDYWVMGCLCSKNADSRTSRIARWNATGIVALRDSNLKVLPDEVLEVNNNVRTIDLTNNKVSVLPPDISRLVQLQRLILANNVLQSLPNTVASLRSLKILTLDGNKISILPDELGSLSKLEQLSVSCNLLTCLPDTIGKLHNLSLLNVSSNKLKSLPPSIGSCIALEELQANDNNIEELPESLCNLSHLKSLLLNNNRVNQLPPKLFSDCKSLQNIALHCNPITADQFQQVRFYIFVWGITYIT